MNFIETDCAEYPVRFYLEVGIFYGFGSSALGARRSPPRITVPVGTLLVVVTVPPPAVIIS